MSNNQKVIDANIDINLLLEPYDLEPMFADEYISKLANMSNEFDSMLSEAAKKMNESVLDTALLHKTIGEMWAKHKELIVLIKPYVMPINILNDMASNLETTSYFKKPEEVLAVTMLHSIYINHYDQMLYFVSLNDALIHYHHEQNPNQPVPEVLVRNIMPTMQTLNAESVGDSINVFHEVLKNMAFQPTANFDLPAVSVISEITPQKRKNGLIEYLNTHLNHRDRLMGYQLRKDAPQEKINLFQADDFPKIIYIDRIAGDGQVVYKIFMCPAPLEQFQSHLHDFGIRIDEDALLYEWVVEDDKAVFENWLVMCDNIQGVGDPSFGGEVEIKNVLNFNSIQMVNIIDFIAKNFEFFYFNGIGMYQNNMAETKLNLTLLNQEKPVRFS